MARFRAGAKLTIAARAIAGCMNADIICFIARIDRATHAVPAGNRRSRLATQCRMTDFSAVTVLTVAARSMIGRVVTGIGCFVARIRRAGHSVAATWGRTRYARSGRGVAGLRAVTVQPVVALRIGLTRNA